MHEKILIVDDSRQIVELVQMLLEQEGYTVSAAFDGVEALRSVKEFKPDLIILDIMMPYIDGYHLAHQLIHEQFDFPVPKIIVLTSRSGEREKKLSYAVGALAYVQKPFEPESFVKKVKEVLSNIVEEEGHEKDTDRG